MIIDNLIAAIEHLTGFVIVLIALSALWGLTALIGRIFGSTGTIQPAVATPTPSPVAASAHVGSSEVDEDLVVVTAAVTAMLAGRHRIVSVRPVASSWGQEGRRDIHASHRLR